MKTLQPCQGRIKENIQNSQQIDWFQRKGNVSLKPHATDQTQERKLYGKGKACRFLWTTPFSSSIIIVKQLWDTHINFL
jgi:hypothetical protein